jgi:CheY-like chemotaxis protein
MQANQYHMPTPRVLIIDDDADQLIILTAALAADYEVLTAADGLDGYGIACAECPSVIVLDVMMPVVDGWTVLRKLRSNARTKDARIVVVTAMDHDAVAAEAARYDVSAVFQKPVDLRQLKAALKRATAR